MKPFDAAAPEPASEAAAGEGVPTPETGSDVAPGEPDVAAAPVEPPVEPPEAPQAAAEEGSTKPLEGSSPGS